MSEQFVPNYIRRIIDYKTKDILTAQEYNAILNLIITQGDYNSKWLEYLQNHGIPDAIAEMSAEAVAEAITTAVRQELEALSISVRNKTSRQLDNPAITILNIGQNYTGIAALKTLLDTKNLNATYAIATNLVGNGVYATVAQLTALKNAGNDIVAYSTDGATMTAEDAASAVNNAHTFIDLYGFNKNIFVYPNGNSIAAVTDAVHEKFKYAVNAVYEDILDPADYPSNVDYPALYNLPIIKWNSTIDIDTIKDYIDTVVNSNKYMIIQIDTDSSSYDETLFEDVLDYMLTKSFIEYPTSINAQMLEVQNTLDNELALLEGIYITEENGDKYINW